MKIFKTAVLAALMVSGVAVAAHAADAIISGEVAPISNYTFTPSTLALPNDMTAVGNTDIVVGALTINNNNVGGYAVTISSAKSGKLVRCITSGGGAAYFPVTDGNSTAYTIKLVANSTPGISGMTAPTNFLATDTALTQAAVFNFANPTTATVAAKYDMSIKAAANTLLLDSNDQNEQYRDTLTVTVSDLN